MCAVCGESSDRSLREAAHDMNAPPSEDAVFLQDPKGVESGKKCWISTHVLDTSRGRPAAGLPVRLYKYTDRWILLKESDTDHNGRCADLLAAPASPFRPGLYKLHFDVLGYFSRANVETMFPTVDIVFDVKDAEQSYHVPLLLSPFSFATYRGS
ncbi:hypothetical protein KM043_010489 [Ampulex compressa]|nr:hypothetical protein KM043_010489 [Ampulex compressa]